MASFPILTSSDVRLSRGLLPHLQTRAKPSQPPVRKHMALGKGSMHNTPPSWALTSWIFVALFLTHDGPVGVDKTCNINRNVLQYAMYDPCKVHLVAYTSIPYTHCLYLTSVLTSPRLVSQRGRDKQDQKWGWSNSWLRVPNASCAVFPSRGQLIARWQNTCGIDDKGHLDAEARSVPMTSQDNNI